MALLGAAKAGDPRALRRLLETVSRPALRFASGFCRNPEDAEDVVQDVLASLARSLFGFRGDSALSTWAYTVARNVCLRKRRRKMGEPSRLETLDGAGDRAGAPALEVRDPARGADEELERGELRSFLQDAIGSLPPSQREVLVLRDVEGLPAKEVGKILDLNERAVKSRLHRARLAVRERLAPYYFGGSLPVSRSPHSCPDTALLLSRYLEGEMDPGTCARLESHVSGCPSCGAACLTLRATLAACRDWGGKPLPPEVRGMVRRAISDALAEARE